MTFIPASPNCTTPEKSVSPKQTHELLVAPFRITRQGSGTRHTGTDCADDHSANSHQYKDENLRLEIFENYNKKYKPVPTPYSHPEQFDPLNPPEGWAYDPFYEIWIQL